MKVFEMAGAVMALVLYAGLISLPGMGIACLGWRSSRAMRPVFVQTFFRAGLLATTITPSVHGHAGILPAIILVFVLQRHERLAGIVPILVVWLLAIPAISARAKNSSE